MAVTPVLRPDMQALLDEVAREQAENPGLKNLSWTEMRARSELTAPTRWGEPDDVAHVEDLEVNAQGRTLPVRIYRPEDARGSVLFVHGGGWVTGSIDTQDGAARLLANRAGCAVVSVGYRKAPEAPYPAGLDDCEAALRWLAESGPALGLDAARPILGGESAGGNLAASLALRARDKGLPVGGQVLIYPVTDGRMGSQSYKEFGSGYMLEAEGMRNCYQAYAPDEATRLGPEVSVLLAEDLAGLAPAFVATCEFDPLRDEGRAYAARLVEAGVDVRFKEYRGALHGIWIMRAITPLADEIVGDAADFVADLVRRAG